MTVLCPAAMVLLQHHSSPYRMLSILPAPPPATIYDIKVTDISSEINGSATTKPDELSFTPSVILNVDDSALPGGDGSAAAPFQPIQNAVDTPSPATSHNL